MLVDTVLGARGRRPASSRQSTRSGVDGRVLPGTSLGFTLCCPVLDELEAVPPIEHVDELLDAVAHALEAVESSDEAERLIYGISWLCDQRPDDFDRRKFMTR